MTAQSSQDRHQNGRFLPHIVACVLATSIVIKGKPALAQEGEAQVSTGSRLTIKLLAADSDGDGYRDLTEDEFPQDASEHKDEFRYDADRYAVATPDAAGILAVTSDLPIDAPAGRSSLSNPIVALNQNN